MSETLANIDISEQSDGGDSSNETQGQESLISKKRKGSPLRRATLKKHNRSRWLSGRASASGSGGRGFDPRPRHTKGVKNGTSGYLAWCSVL